MNQELAYAIQRFSRHLKRRFPDSATAIHYENDLVHFSQVIDKPPIDVNRADITVFSTRQLTEGMSPATVNRRLAALRSFFNFLALEAESDEWANPVIWDLHGIKRGHHLPRDLHESVARAFWAAVCQGPVRDQAMVALMLDVGLRVGEVAASQVQDFEPSIQEASLAGLRVYGKGNKERKVWLVAETAALVQAWLDERPNVADQALFITRRRRGFSIRGIQDRVKHYTRKAGLAADQVSCHRLRHTFARRMAESGMPLPSLSHWLGHSQLQTTKTYTDGARQKVQADYQAAMEALSQVAERQQEPQPEPPSVPVPESAAPTLEPRPALTKTELEERFSLLPGWLGKELAVFVQVRQARWDPFQRRKHSFLWSTTLRNIWTWLLQERQIESFAQLRRVDLEAYLTYLHEKGRSASTLNVHTSILLAFMRYLEEHDWPVSPGLFRVARSKMPKRQPRPLTDAEYWRLERAVHAVTSRESPRAAALECSWFFILTDGGLRVNELLTLTVGDWDPDSYMLTIRVAKGGNERRVPLTARAAKALNAHLAYRRPVGPNEPLILYRGKSLQYFHVKRWLGIFSEVAKVENVTPHRLRHTYATRLLNTGKMPIATLQRLMGHRKMDTTMQYVALHDETVQQDYQTAMQPLVTETGLDWDIWGPAVDAILEQEVPEF
jgi:site-specific recombinase XerD